MIAATCYSYVEPCVTFIVTYLINPITNQTAEFIHFSFSFLYQNLLSLIAPFAPLCTFSHNFFYDFFIFLNLKLINTSTNLVVLHYFYYCIFTVYSFFISLLIYTEFFNLMYSFPAAPSVINILDFLISGFVNKLTELFLFSTTQYFNFSIFAALIISLKFVALIALLVFSRGGIPRYRFDYLTKLG